MRFRVLTPSFPESEATVEGGFASIGRHPSNLVHVLDMQVSKEHCAVEIRGDRILLRDLGSRNGTRVDGQPVSGEVELRHGSEIRIGLSLVVFLDDSRDSSPPPEPRSDGAVSARFG